MNKQKTLCLRAIGLYNMVLCCMGEKCGKTEESGNTLKKHTTDYIIHKKSIITVDSLIYMKAIKILKYRVNILSRLSRQFINHLHGILCTGIPGECI